MKKTISPLSVGMLMLLIMSCIAIQKNETSSDTVIDKDERMEWWREARFGLFIHWGVYALPAGKYGIIPTMESG